MKRSIIIVLVVSLSSCNTSEKEQISIVFSRNDFPKTTVLAGEELQISSDKYVQSFNVINDTIVLARYKKAYPYYFGLYNLNSGSKFVEFAERGNGPGEFLGGKYLSNAYNIKQPEIIHIIDVITKKVSVFNLDSLLFWPKSHVYLPVQFELPDGVFNFCKLDSSRYVCYNSYYLDDKVFSNNNDMIFLVNTHGKPRQIREWKYFTLNVSSGYILISKKENRIIVTDRNKDRIEIFDTLLNHIRTIRGPDIFEPKYKLRFSNHISFEPGTVEGGFYPCCSTEDYIYHIYRGRYDFIPNSTKRQPVEIFKLDWEGNLVENFILDRFIYTISITGDGKIFYGTSYNSFGDPILVRFNIE